MVQYTEKERIAALEAALRECLQMLASLPYNPALSRFVTRIEEVVLPPHLVAQPFFGERAFDAKGGVGATDNKLYRLGMMLHPDGRVLELKGVGQFGRVARGLDFCLQQGLRFDLEPDAIRAHKYFMRLEQVQAERNQR